jgi:hypothetical protein
MPVKPEPRENRQSSMSFAQRERLRLLLSASPKYEAVNTAQAA